MSGACRILRLTWDEADGIMERAVRRGLQRRDLSGLRRIGIDEKAVRRGHRYITVVYNLNTVRAHAIKETFRCFWGYTYPANVQRFITAFYFH